jgi:Actinobacteria/chloroflexi VLRF1 release factor
MPNGRAGDTRWLDVAPDRLPAWLASFARRHGGLAADPAVEQGSRVTFLAADGAIAECHVPFPPLRPVVDLAVAELAAAPPDAAELAASVPSAAVPDAAVPGDAELTVAAPPAPQRLVTAMTAHASADRLVGVFLVRLGGYAAGVFSGSGQPALVASKVGSRLVHGRSAAGGTSQHRFARRREKQAYEALGAAANCAVGVFTPYAGRLDAVVLGGDKRTMAGLDGDPRLRPYLKLAVDRFLTVPDPRLAVLKSTPPMFRAIRVKLTEPAARA